MFIGEYNHNVDAKGRVSLPARFRDDLTETFYITKGLESCLFIYDENEWKAIDAKMRALRVTAKAARSFSRLFYGSAQELSADRQGRILIPSSLISYADIDKEVVIVGVSNRIEIWAKEKWATYMEATSDSYEDLAEQLEDLDF